MRSKFCTPAAVAAVLLALGAAAAARRCRRRPPSCAAFAVIRRAVFRAYGARTWARAQMFGVRQKKGVAEMEWKSAPLPTEIRGESVTFVLTGAMGSGPSGGSFTIFVNGHAAADCDAVLESTQFPARAKNCRLLYDVLFTCNGQESSGHFFLTVPKAWVKAGQAAALQVKATDVGCGDVVCADARRRCAAGDSRSRLDGAHPGRVQEGRNAAPAGRRGQLRMVPQTVLRPGRFHAHRPARRPDRSGRLAQRAARAPSALTRSRARIIPSTAWHSACGKTARRCGWASRAPRQSLEDGYLPIVLTLWRHGDLDIRQRATAEPLRGTSYETGLESTLAWAVFDITNHGKQPREITFFAAQSGDNETSQAEPQLPRRRGDGRRQCPLRPRRSRPASAWSSRRRRRATTSRTPSWTATTRGPCSSRAGCTMRCLARGRIEPGQTVRVVVNRVFDFPAGRIIGAELPPRWRPRN